MPRFQKTRIHAAAAALFLIGLYALGGLGYALWAGSAESVTIWVVLAVVAFVAAVAYQRFVAARRDRAS